MIDIWECLNQVKDATVVTKLNTGAAYVPAVARLVEVKPTCF